MAFKNSIDFNLINLEAISDEELNTSEGMNKIADNIMLNVSGSITRASGENSYDHYADKEEIFKRTSINNKTVDSLLNNLEIKGKTTFNKVQRNQIGSYMVARAILDKTDVVVMPYRAKTLEDGIKINDAFENIPPATVSLWDKFLALFGVQSAKQKIAAQTKNATIQQHLKALEADAKENHMERREKIIKENFDIADKLRAKYNDYITRSNEEENQINKMYMENMPKKAFKKPNELNSLVGGGEFNVRSFPYIGICAMLKNGYTLKQACDPNFTEGRDKVGQELGEISRLHATKEKEKIAQGDKLLGEIFLKGGKKFLEQPMPSKEELTDFHDSKTPFYTSAVAIFGHTIFQPLEKTNDINDPDIDILSKKLMDTSALGMFAPIVMTSVAKDFYRDRICKDPDEAATTKENLCKTVMKLEAQKQCANQIVNYNVKTIEDYITVNNEAALQSSALEYSLPAFVTDCLAGENMEPMKLNDIMENKVSVFDTIKLDQVYNAKLNMFAQDMSTFGKGTYAQMSARAELAKNVADKMFYFTGWPDPDDYNDERNKVAKGLLDKPSFMKLTDVEPEQIKKLNKSIEFVKNLTRDMHDEDVKEQQQKAIEKQKALDAAKERKAAKEKSADAPKKSKDDLGM